MTISKRNRPGSRVGIRDLALPLAIAAAILVVLTPCFLLARWIWVTDTEVKQDQARILKLEPRVRDLERDATRVVVQRDEAISEIMRAQKAGSLRAGKPIETLICTQLSSACKNFSDPNAVASYSIPVEDLKDERVIAAHAEVIDGAAGAQVFDRIVVEPDPHRADCVLLQIKGKKNPDGSVVQGQARLRITSLVGPA